MSKSNSGHFSGTLGTTASGLFQHEETYADRGIEVPTEVKNALVKLRNKGDYIIGSKKDFSEVNVSIMARETGVEFAKVTIGNKAYLIRGDSNGTYIPYHLLNRIVNGKGRIDFHCHPHADDVVPSVSDLELMKKLKFYTGQSESKIIATNGKTSWYNDQGIISIDAVHNRIDDNLKSEYIKLFGGK